MKRILLALIVALGIPAFAQQSITIPAQTVTTPVTINGTTVQLSITVPAQTVALPAQALPAGLTWSNGVLAVAGSVQATSVSLTGGPALPTCASNLYLWAPAASGSGVLQPACYVPVVVPPITVASSAANTITLTP